MKMKKYEQLVLQGKETYLKTLDEIEWFKYPQNSRDKIASKLNESNDNFYLDLHHLSFFNDDFYSIKDYKELLENITQITGLNFLSTEFDLDEKANKVKVKIATEEKSIKMKFDLGEYMMIPQIDKEINKLAEKFELDSRFLWLPLESDIFFYVYIPVKLYKQAVKKGVIPKDSEYLDSL